MKRLMTLTMCVVAAACSDATFQPDLPLEPQLAKGGGRGGGPGGGGETPLSVVFTEPGTIVSDGLGPYLDGQDGVDATIGSGGALNFLVGEGATRQVVVGDILDSAGDTLVTGPGSSGIHMLTTGCCDLRSMTSSGGDGNPMPVKLKVRWNVSDGAWILTMGATSNCIDGSTPDNDPTRGTWAQASQVAAGADTTWTVGTVGPAALCRLIDLPGKKNDTATLVSIDAAVDLTLTMTND